MSLKSQENKPPLHDIISEICDTYNIREKSFWNIKKYGPTPPKRTKSNRIKYSFCDNDYEVIDDIICELNKQNYCVYIYDVYKYVKSDPNCDLSFKDCKRDTFYKLFKQMGYKYSYNKKIIREEIINSERIQKLIKNYLLEKLRLEKILSTDGKKPPVVYLDESVIHKNYVQNKALQPQDVNKRQKMKRSVDKGVRFSVINAGSEEGFVNKAELIVYNNEINAQIFEQWLETQLLPNIPPNTVVIYDNCSVHSRQFNKTPTQNSNN
jgi:hypothetical protein